MSVRREHEDKPRKPPVFLGDSTQWGGCEEETGGGISFVCLPNETWTIGQLENHSVVIRSCLERGDEPGLLTPVLEYTEKMPQKGR